MWIPRTNARGLKRTASIVLAILLIWGILVYLTDMPIRMQRFYICSVCRESKTLTYFALIPVGWSTRSSEFSTFYLKNADPHHHHVWIPTGRMYTTRTHTISGHGRNEPLRLVHEVALAILRSLPDAASRKAFFMKLQEADGSFSRDQAERSRISAAIWKLNEAYWENRNRNDWLEQVREVGLYPEPIADTPSR